MGRLFAVEIVYRGIFQKTLAKNIGESYLKQVYVDGYLDTMEGMIRIPTICLEEEAARKVVEDGLTTTYNLDRLGIPLVEITTAPDIKSPGQAREVALKIGEILRATGRVKRGIGTIRQDINVSIEGGARVEIKGVQELNTISRIIENEVERQKGLLEIKNKLMTTPVLVCAQNVLEIGRQRRT